ncbi:MAG: XdhC family protein [Solidesulfovibrio sp. DCME]|uniref:XdhC family protein n=1 Tax=Solidesulfovibrio sp. DCME TaxID=3447380 RepID=UPI003D14189A
MRDLIDTVNRVLGRGESLVAAAVVAKAGSSPGPAGARMLLFDDADIAGTVGGGPLEGRTIAAAVETMGTGRPQRFEMDLSGDIGDDVDAICGGIAEVFVERLDPTPATRAVFAALAGQLATNTECLLVSALEGGREGGPARGLLDAAGHQLAGTLAEAVVREAGRLAPALSEAGIAVLGGGRYFLEPFRRADTVYLCGAGHVARPTAQFAAMAGFRVVVLDDRAAFANRERFPLADEVVVLPSFAACFAGNQPDADASVVIVSRCHKQDRTILVAALGTEAGYIGMIGSARKTAAVLDEMVAKGFSRRSVARVRAPIGLPIGGDTPVEIAVSIVAELIEARTARRAAKAASLASATALQGVGV